MAPPVAPAPPAAAVVVVVVVVTNLPVLRADLRFPAAAALATAGLSGLGLLVGRGVLQLLDGQVAGLVVGVSAHGLRGGQQRVGGGEQGGGGVGGVVGVRDDVHRVLVGQVRRYGRRLRHVGGGGGGGGGGADERRRRRVGVVVVVVVVVVGGVAVVVGVVVVVGAVADVHVLLVLEGVVQGLGGPALGGAGVLEPVDDVGEVQGPPAFARVQAVQLAHVAHHLLARGVLVVLEPLLQAGDLVLRVEGGSDPRLAGHQYRGVGGGRLLQAVVAALRREVSCPVRQKLGLVGR